MQVQNIIAFFLSKGVVRIVAFTKYKSSFSNDITFYYKSTIWVADEPILKGFLNKAKNVENSL